MDTVVFSVTSFSNAQTLASTPQLRKTVRVRILDELREAALLSLGSLDEIAEAEYELVMEAHEEYYRVLRQIVDQSYAGNRQNSGRSARMKKPPDACGTTELLAVLEPAVLGSVPRISQLEIVRLSALRILISASEDDLQLNPVAFDGVSEITSRYIRIACAYVLGNMRAPRPERPGGDVSGHAFLRLERSSSFVVGKSSSFIETLRSTARITIRSKRFSSSLAVRNDPGEQLLWKPELGWYGFDRVAGFIRWAPGRIPVQVTAGQYALDFGQGVLWSRPFGQRRDSSAPHRSLRHSSGVRGVSSTSGTSHMTGVALQVQPKSHTRAVLFYSRRFYDARQFTSGCETPCFETGDLSGLDSSFDRGQQEPWKISSSERHVTSDQIARKNAIQARVVGAVLEHSFSTLALGMSYASTTFDKPFIWGRRTKPILSTQSANVFGTWTTSQLSVSGEWSFEDSRFAGSVIGAVLRPARHLTGIALFRYYRSSDSGLYGGGSGLSPSLDRQWGALLGWRFVSPGKWHIAASTAYQTGNDLSSDFTGPRYQVDTRVFSEISAIPGARIRIQLRQKRSLKLQKTGRQETLEIDYTAIVLIEQFYAEMLYSISPSLQTRLRMDINVARIGNANAGTGFQMYHQVDLSVSGRLGFSVRGSVFEADTGLNRIYVYEPDVSGKLTAPSVSGSGHQFLILMRISDLLGLKVEMKFRHRSYSDTYSELSDLTDRPSVRHQTRQQLTFQLSYDF